MSRAPRWQRRLSRRLNAKYRARPPRDTETRAEYAQYVDHIRRCRPLRDPPLNRE